MPTQETSTGESVSGRMVDIKKPDEMSEILDAFYFRLPRPKNLQEEGINRFRQFKSDMYLTQAMRDLVEKSNDAEVTEAESSERLKPRKERNYSFLSEQRFMTSETDHPLNLDTEEYWSSMPKSWSDEQKELKNDIKSRIQRRTSALKPRILRSGVIPKLNSLSLKLEQVRSSHSAICQTALSKTISEDRKKKIRSEISDMDLWNRPMHHLYNPLIDKKQKDPLEGSETLETMYSGVRRKVSAETLNNLLNPEPDLEDYIKTHNDIATATETQHDKQQKSQSKATFSSRPRLPEDDVNSVSSSSVFGEHSMDTEADYGFGLDCLRDLVKFQDEAWNLQDSDSESGSIQKKPTGSSTGSPGHLSKGLKV